MPFPMIHFSISYRVFEGSPNNAFLLGSISPDAVQLRYDKESKSKSHLHDGRGSYPKWSGLLEFYNALISDCEDEDYKWFIMGYLSHIIADHQWVMFKRRISNSDKNILKTIWNEEAQYNFNLYRTVSWREEVKNNITNSPLYGIDNHYSLDELDKWRQEIFYWLDAKQNEPNIKNVYLQESNVEAFMNDTSIHIKEWMEQNLGVVDHG